ncbi:TfoX/Sxy family protein [Salmonella enterica]|nr:TfoX/Sxy family protein [Salmonella enterica]ECD9475724.1 TfoX/Sxy family protein [Salmonella enterica subsp. houtenae]
MGNLMPMMNIGKEIERKLNSVGIFTPEDLINAGSKKAFLRLKHAHPNVCLVHLYVLHGAICNTDYRELAPETKRMLKTYSDGIK